MTSSIAVLGAGSWGTALALLAARNGYDTLLWAHHAEHANQLKHQRENRKYLPGHFFPENLHVTDQLESALKTSSTILLVIPSHAFRQTLLKIKPLLRPEHKIAWATKGFCPQTGTLLNQVVETVIDANVPLAVLSGPTFAAEVAAGLPTAITIASVSTDFADLLTRIFHNQRFRTYTSSDIIGVQAGGAVKNVLAIAAGIADGLGFGANTRAALITRGLNEIIKLGIHLGGQADTFMGLAGLGDLILTCTDNKSRNRRFGLALGQGQSKHQAIEEISQEIEGLPAAKETFGLAVKHSIEMPITEQTYHVLYNNLDPRKAVENLLSRDLKPEDSTQLFVKYRYTAR